MTDATTEQILTGDIKYYPLSIEDMEKKIKYYAQVAAGGKQPEGYVNMSVMIAATEICRRLEDLIAAVNRPNS